MRTQETVKYINTADSEMEVDYSLAKTPTVSCSICLADQPQVDE